jgi:hypothetical protein
MLDEETRSPSSILRGAVHSLVPRIHEDCGLAFGLIEKALDLIETGFRDPVDTLEQALIYLMATRGVERAQKSLAWDIIDQRRETLENLCIAELLGRKAEEKHIACQCWRHPGNFEREFYGPPPAIVLTPPEGRKPRLSGKDLAAGEREEE